MTLSPDAKDITGARLPLVLVANGLLWLGLAVGAAAVLFWPGLVSLADAWQTPEYSHGPVIPLLSTYLFLHKMQSVPPADRPVHNRWPGILIVGIALVIGLLGNIVSVPDITTYALILWIGGMILVCFGARRGRHFWPAVLHLVFMLPLPQFMYWRISTLLQLVSSEIGVAVIALFGITVYLDGNVIDLGVYKLQVAEACSGLRYLFPVMSFSFVFAVLYTGPTWQKVVILLSAAPVTVLMNSFRIGMIGVLVDNFGTAQAEGFLHAFEGWVIFVACVAILFGLAVLMQRLQRHPQPLGETIDLDIAGAGAQLRRVGAFPASLALISAMLLTGVAALGLTYAPARATVAIEREPLVRFPAQIGDWSGQAAWLDPQIERVLGADDYHIASYTDPADPRPVALFIAWYTRQVDGQGIHSPQVCLPGGGWGVSKWDTTRVTLSPGDTVDVVQAVIHKGLDRALVYYWFQGRGRRLTNDYLAKAYVLWDSATTGRTDGAIVRILTPIGIHESEATAAERLTRFMAESRSLLPRFVPD